jgi:molybdopterin synthase sulfur carrier subunit
MPHVVFTSALQRFLSCPPRDVEGQTVREILDRVFSDDPRVRPYVVDEQGALRKHMTIFIDNEAVRDRTGLSDSVRPDSQIYVMQALSGG